MEKKELNKSTIFIFLLVLAGILFNFSHLAWGIDKGQILSGETKKISLFPLLPNWTDGHLTAMQESV